MDALQSTDPFTVDGLEMFQFGTTWITLLLIFAYKWMCTYIFIIPYNHLGVEPKGHKLSI